MTDWTDILLGDDTSQMLRAMQKRIDYLERQSIHYAKTGMMVDWSLATKSAKWSWDRAESVGSNYTRWWNFNDINETHTFADVSGDPALALNGPAAQGQVGGMQGEGSYSAGFTGTLISGGSVIAMPTRGWSMEITFNPDALPQSGYLCYNGTNTANGQGLRIGDGSGGSGSFLTIHLGGIGYYNTGITLVTGNWYHVVVVSDDTDNLLKWYVGILNPVTKAFSIVSGSIAVAASVAPTGGIFPFYAGDGFTGKIDNLLYYTGKIPGGTNPLSAEDRIRNAIQPHAPRGWIPCDGAAVARNRYDRLFATYGTYHGVGDGTTTFNLPNIPGAIVKI